MTGNIIRLFHTAIENWFRALWCYPRSGGYAVITLNNPFAVVLFLVSVMWYLWSPGGEIVMVAAALGGINLLAFLWARTMARRVDAERRLRYSAFQVGDQLEETITLHNRSILPVLWAEFRDHSDLPGYTLSSVRAASPESKVVWRTGTECRQRGIYSLGPWHLLTGDPFGIFKVKLEYDDKKEIVVYPPLTPLPHISIPHINKSGNVNPLRRAVHAETNNVFTVRQYQQNDPLRHLHWKTSARKQNLFVKQFDPEAASSVWIVPDFDAAAHTPATEDKAVILSASLASQLLSDNLSVGLFTRTGLPVVVPPRSGRAHIWEFLRALVSVHASHPQPLLNTLLEGERVFSQNDLILVVTPSLDTGWALQLKSRIHFGSGTLNQVAVHAVLLDPLSFPLPDQPRQSSHNTVHQIQEQLSAAGIGSQILRDGDIQPILGTHGVLRRWEFKTLGTGRIVVKQTPREVEVI